jgi:hypothetical protein
MNDAAQPWKTDNWHVSPWNYVAEVTEGFQPPEKVRIHDITLRDGEQQAGIIFTKDDKIRIAEKLAEAGVHRIEAGMPAVSPNDEKAIREIVKRNLGSEIFCFCRCMVKDVDLAADCGADGIVIEIPASKHLIEQGYKWPLEKAIDLSIKATAHAKEKGQQGGQGRPHGCIYPGGYIWRAFPQRSHLFHKKGQGEGNHTH